MSILGVSGSEILVHRAGDPDSKARPNLELMILDRVNERQPVVRLCSSLPTIVYSSLVEINPSLRITLVQ